MITKVFEQPLLYDRTAIVLIKDDVFLIDGSGEEYGWIKVPLSLLKEKIKEHEQLQESLLQTS